MNFFLLFSVGQAGWDGGVTSTGNNNNNNNNTEHISSVPFHVKHAQLR